MAVRAEAIRAEGKPPPASASTWARDAGSRDVVAPGCPVVGSLPPERGHPQRSRY
jgi:hypothetical protein